MPPPPSAPRTPWRVSDVAWAGFLIWTAVGFVVMPFGIDETQVRVWITRPGLRDAVVLLLHTSDAIWILLAAITAYLHAVAEEGLGTARRQAAVILAASTIIEWIGATTGFPFGPYRYTENFGARLGGVVPLAIPLAWYTVLICGKNLVQRLRPHPSRLELASGIAIVATLTDLNLEFVAWKVRTYWIWYPGQNLLPAAGPPVQNYVSWFALSFVLAWFLPGDHRLRSVHPPRNRPVLVLVLMNALLACVHAVFWWRHRLP